MLPRGPGLNHVFSALADPTRRAIIERLLAEGDKTVGEIAKPFRISAPAITRHLQVLEDAGLVEKRVERQFRVVRARPEALRPLGSWYERQQRHWSDAFDRLEAVIAAGATSVTLSALTVNTAYVYRLKALNAGGDSVASSNASVTTKTVTPTLTLALEVGKPPRKPRVLARMKSLSYSETVAPSELVMRLSTPSAADSERRAISIASSTVSPHGWKSWRSGGVPR